MISEVKIKVGTRQDEYLVLSLTVLDRLQDMQLNVDPVTRHNRRSRRDKVCLYWRDLPGGRSMLMIGTELARELVDNLALVRTIDAHGHRHYEWAAA